MCNSNRKSEYFAAFMVQMLIITGDREKAALFDSYFDFSFYQKENDLSPLKYGPKMLE